MPYGPVKRPTVIRDRFGNKPKRTSLPSRGSAPSTGRKKRRLGPEFRLVGPKRRGKGMRLS